MATTKKEKTLHPLARSRAREDAATTANSLPKPVLQHNSPVAGLANGAGKRRRKFLRPEALEKKMQADRAKEMARRAKLVPQGQTVEQWEAVVEWARHKYGLSDQDLRAEGVRFVAQKVATVMLKQEAVSDAFLIPYNGFDHEPWDFFRFRFLDAPKDMRYMQGTSRGAKNSGVELYLSLRVDWDKILADLSAEVIVIEGEPKAMKLVKEEFTAAGIGGIGNWHGESEGQEMIEHLVRLVRNREKVVIMFDANARTNPMVGQQMSKLVLAAAKQGARVKAVIVPEGGADEYLMEHGREALRNVIDATPEAEATLQFYRLASVYFYVRNEGRYVVWPKPGDVDIVRLKPQDVFDYEADETIAIKGKDGNLQLKEAAKEFHKSKIRPKFTCLCCEPGNYERVTKEGGFNLWYPPNIVPKSNARLMARIRHWREGLIRDPSILRHVLRWQAIQVQVPGIHIDHSILLWATETGIGKTLMGLSLLWQHGEENSVIIGQNQLTSRFNGGMAYKTFAMFEEFDVIEKDDFKMISFIITNDRIPIEYKGRDVLSVPNHLNPYFSSNSPRALPVKEDDRRFLVWHATRPEMTNDEIEALAIDMKSAEGRSVLRDDLLRMDTSGFNAKGRPPMTDAKAEMIDYGRKPQNRWAKMLKQDRKQALRMHDKPAPIAKAAIAASEDLADIYNADKTDKDKVNTYQIGDAMSEAEHKQTGKVRIPAEFVQRGAKETERFWITDPLRYENEPLGQLIEEWAKIRYGAGAKLESINKRKFLR
jgi:hypothetical protein